MDTKSCSYCKAAHFEKCQMGSSSNKRARTEPPFINGLADLQRRRGTLSLILFLQKSEFSSINPSLCLAVTPFVDSSSRDSVIQRAKIVLDNPIPGEPSLEYYRAVETDLCNRLLGCIQRLDLELKLHEILSAEHETALELVKEHEETEGYLANN